MGVARGGPASCAASLQPGREIAFDDTFQPPYIVALVPLQKPLPPTAPPGSWLRWWYGDVVPPLNAQAMKKFGMA
jgi:hypothetical protein